MVLLVVLISTREREIFCLKKSESRKKREKRSRDCLESLEHERKLLFLDYLPILNENMAKSSPLSRNDQTFCCPFPVSVFQIVPSVSSASSLLPRRARCSSSFNSFIFFFWITQSSQISVIIHHACCGTIITKSEITKRTTEKNKTLSLSLSLVSKNNNTTTTDGAFERFRA